MLHLNLLLLSYGAHWAAWRQPDLPTDLNVDLKTYIHQATLAESAFFDSVFVADTPALMDNSTRPLECLDATVLLSSLIPATSRIGLIGTMSTTHNEPYNVARRLASIDHLSQGRAGWNIVTSDYREAQENFGVDATSHDALYKRSEEFVEVCLQLWQSWSAGAVVGDHAHGIFADRSKISPIDHEGDFFRVRGPMQTPPSPQGRPLLVQAGASAAGRRLSAKFADAVYTIQRYKHDSLQFRRELQKQAVARGRRAHDVKVLPGIVPYVGSSREAARQMKRELDALADRSYSINRLAKILGVSPRSLHLDETLPSEIPDTDETTVGQTRRNLLLKTARDDNMKVRDLISLLEGGGGHLNVVGNGDDVADIMEEWYTCGAADGFTIMPPSPSSLEPFIEHVIPVLQRRRRFRTSYKENSLRERMREDL